MSTLTNTVSITASVVLGVGVVLLSQSEDANLYQVKRVTDGDTVVFTLPGQTQELKVRLLCIDAPELKQPYGYSSRDFLRFMLQQEGNKVYLSTRGKDRYGRTLAEILTSSGTNLNQEMVRYGMAYYSEPFRASCPEYAVYSGLQREAKLNKFGFWAEEKQEYPWDWRRARAAARN